MFPLRDHNTFRNSLSCEVEITGKGLLSENKNIFLYFYFHIVHIITDDTMMYGIDGNTIESELIT